MPVVPKQIMTRMVKALRMGAPVARAFRASGGEADGWTAESLMALPECKEAQADAEMRLLEKWWAAAENAAEKGDAKPTQALLSAIASDYDAELAVKERMGHAPTPPQTAALTDEQILRELEFRTRAAAALEAKVVKSDVEVRLLEEYKKR